jgi:hypothetical protein
MEQSPSSEANNRSVKKFSAVVREGSFSHTRCSQTLDPMINNSCPISFISILMLSSHLCVYFPNGLVPSVSPTKILYAFIISSMRATFSAYLIFDFVAIVIITIGKV